MGLFDFIVDPKAKKRSVINTAVEGVKGHARSIFDNYKAGQPELELEKLNPGFTISDTLEKEIEFYYFEVCLPNAFYEMSNNARHSAKLENEQWQNFKKENFDFINEMISKYAYNIYRISAAICIQISDMGRDHSVEGGGQY